MNNKIFTLVCYHLGLWGILGFFATILTGLIICFAGLSETLFFTLLIGFAILGITATAICLARDCKKL